MRTPFWATSSWAWAAIGPVRSLCCRAAGAWRCWPAALPAWRSHWCSERRRRHARWSACSLWSHQAGGGWHSSPTGWYQPSAPPVWLKVETKRQSETNSTSNFKQSMYVYIYFFFGGIFLYILLPEPVWYRIILLKFNDVGIFLFCFKSVMTLNCIVNLQNNKNMFKNLTVNNKRSGGFQNHLLFLTNVNKSRGGWCWGRAIPAGGPSPSSSCRSNSWPASLLQAFQTASETWRWPPWTCQCRHRL